jgi:hypothetical protein
MVQPMALGDAAAGFQATESSPSKELPTMSSYSLRLPESLKKAAKRIAAADDTTMNQFFVVAIAEKISAMETADFFQKLAALGNPQTAQSAWDKVGASAALPEDHWAHIADDPSR